MKYIVIRRVKSAEAAISQKGAKRFASPRPASAGLFFVLHKNATELHFIFATQLHLWYGYLLVKLPRLKDPGLSSLYFSPSQGTGEPRSGRADGGAYEDRTAQGVN